MVQVRAGTRVVRVCNSLFPYVVVLFCWSESLRVIALRGTSYFWSELLHVLVLRGTNLGWSVSLQLNVRWWYWGAG